MSICWINYYYVNDWVDGWIKGRTNSLSIAHIRRCRLNIKRDRNVLCFRNKSLFKKHSRFNNTGSFTVSSTISRGASCAMPVTSIIWELKKYERSVVTK